MIILLSHKAVLCCMPTATATLHHHARANMSKMLTQQLLLLKKYFLVSKSMRECHTVPVSACVYEICHSQENIVFFGGAISYIACTHSGKGAILSHSMSMPKVHHFID